MRAGTIHGEERHMADEEHGEREAEGPFLLGSSYAEVGPDLGRLHEARHGWTGSAALTLRPGDGVNWRPEGVWEVRVHCRPDTSSMSLVVERAPSPARLSELTTIFVQVTAALTRVEDSPDAQAHIARGTVRPWRWWATCAAVGATVLALGTWARESPGTGHLDFQSWTGMGKPPSPLDAPSLSNTEEPSAPSIFYPLPEVPFRNQANAPCRPDLGEVEINGGCWVELAQRAPCNRAGQGEYQGKCYSPVSKDRGRTPSAAKP